MKLQRRLLYTPIFHIDTNLINSKGKLVEMNQLEKWHRDEVILINMSETSYAEAQQGNNSQRTQKAMTHIYSIADKGGSNFNSLYDEVASIIFPDGVKDQNQENDVRIVCNASQYHAILVTNDGRSKKQPGGILGNSKKLSHIAKIMSPTEAMSFIRKKIELRDEMNREISKRTGEQLPEWTGKD